MSVPLVSIVIVTWNGRRFLEPCLQAVAAQEGVESETILVDNGSTDGTAEFVAARFPWVRVIRLAENRGFAGGNNIGAGTARGRYVALLNNDTVADPGWLRAMLAGLDEATGVLLTTARVVYMHDPGVIDSAGDGMLRWGGAFKRLHGAPADEARESREVFGVCGAACLMPRAIFEELGGFDEDFFVSHEDVDLSYRARLLGYRCRYVADAVVRHHGSATLGRVSAFAVYHGQRNLEWAYLKNTPGSLLAATLPGHLVYNLAAAAHFARLGLLGTFLRAKFAALRGLGQVLEKRRRVQRSRRVGAAAIAPMLESRWLATKLREKRFDVGVAGGGAMTAPSLCAVLVDYNAGEDLVAALRSIADETAGTAWQAIVVDNASSDGSGAAAAAAFGPQVEVLRNAENVGFGRAVNQALARTSAPLVLIMNPDCRLAPGALTTMQAELFSHPTCALVGPRILDPDGSEQGSARGDPDMLTGLFGRASTLRRLFPGLAVSRRNVVVEATTVGDSVVVDWVSGACMLARREALAAVRGFDARFFLYWEDADLCRRLRAQGYHIRYVPTATAVHQVGRSSRTAKGASVRAFHESAYLYYATHVAKGPLHRALARTLLIIRCWIKLRSV